MGLIKIASRLIKKHGQAGTLLRADVGQDGFGGYVRGLETEHPVMVVTAEYAMELKVWEGGRFNLGDQRMLVSVEGLSLKPETTDRLRIDNVVYRIIRVMALEPAGEVIFFELQLHI